MICPHVLVKSADVFLSFTMTKKTDPRHTRGYGFPKKGFKNGLAIGEDATIGVLLTCKKMYTEAVQVLYSQNCFVTHNVRGFSSSFIGHFRYGIGGVNAAMIKNVSFGVPEQVKWDPDNHLGDFLDIVCNTLPNLNQLTLTTRFHTAMPDPVAFVQYDWPVQRAMLRTAAWITKKHPVLKNAIWRAWSGGNYDMADWIPEWMVDFWITLRPVETKKIWKTWLRTSLDNTSLPRTSSWTARRSVILQTTI